MQDFIAINVVIGDRTYRIKVKTEDEEMVRKTTKQLSEQLVRFKTEYPGKDMQDYVTMVLLWFVSEQNEKTVQAPSQEISFLLEKIEQAIDKTLED